MAYDVDGVRHDEMPVNQTDFHHAMPIYETLPGWKEDISGAARSTTCRPTRRTTSSTSRRFGARISVVGVGPGRDETVILNSLI